MDQTPCLAADATVATDEPPPVLERLEHATRGIRLRGGDAPAPAARPEPVALPSRLAA